MRSLTALSAVGIAALAVIAAPVAHAATGNVSTSELKTIAGMESLAPSAKLGTGITANGVWLERNMPGALACLSADGEGNGLPNGATAALQGWDYRSGGRTYTVGTAIYQYKTAAKAKAAVTALKNRDCPDSAAYKDDDNAPGTPTQQGSDIEGKRHGQQGYSFFFSEKDGNRTVANFTVLRPVGNAVIVSSGVAPMKKSSALEDWARASAIKAVNAYYAASQ